MCSGCAGRFEDGEERESEQDEEREVEHDDSNPTIEEAGDRLMSRSEHEGGRLSEWQCEAPFDGCWAPVEDASDYDVWVSANSIVERRVIRAK